MTNCSHSYFDKLRLREVRKKDFRSDFFVRMTTGRASCGSEDHVTRFFAFPGGNLPCTSEDSSSRHSRVSKPQSSPLIDPAAGPLVPQRFLWVFVQFNQKTCGPGFRSGIRKVVRYFHNGTSRSSPPALRKSWLDSRLSDFDLNFSRTLCDP